MLSRITSRRVLLPSQQMLRCWFSSQSKPFDKVLIANRGEIAQRVMRTCESMGIKTVAVYSTADSMAPFVQQAMEKVCVGPAATSESYLNVDKIKEAISKTGAQAVHPGYGFLSENADFATQITDMGVAWLGPSPQAVRDMGDKLRSKELAEAAGVNVIPGYEGVLTDVQEAVEVANDITYPVLLKAASGGGGKGMRVCYNDDDIREAFPLATQEAIKFFKDDRLLVEKYIENPHHIEFQVLAGFNPTSGDLDICVFAERECSIQRRNQKIIEESPSCLLTEETRQKMVSQVKTLVNQVGYVSAGTVEFLVDEKQNFYFLEMNTRLQVEHPVTEMVSGVDLVKGMLSVGAGFGVPQDFLGKLGDNYMMPHKGHAVEARIYAEDPLRGFLPSTGPLLPYQEPTGENVRVDSGVAPGHMVTPHYDPMLSKVICYSPNNRQEAVEGLAHALDNYVIEGVQHNARLVNDVLCHEAFLEGKTPTSFLPTHFPDGWSGVKLTDQEKAELAVAVAQLHQSKQVIRGLPKVIPDGQPLVVRLGGMFGSAYQVQMLDVGRGFDESTVTVKCLETGEDWVVRVDLPLEYSPTSLLANINFDGKPRTLQVLGEDMTGLLKIQMKGANVDVVVQSPREYELSKHMHEPKEVDTSDMVLSPMPGALISYAVEDGDHVEIGQELCIVEAMKMQNVIKSPRAGTIAKCRVPVGSSLMADEVIIDLVPENTGDEKMAA